MKVKQGFTLIELSLATIFLAVLLLMIATITINISTIYQKGITLRNVNATGRNLIDDINRSVSDAPPIRFEANNTNLYYRSTTGQAHIKRQNEDDHNQTVQFAGTFCSGRYSYVWNTGYVTNKDRYQVSASPVKVKYAEGTIGGDGQAPVRLVKFADPNRVACSDENYIRMTSSSTIDISEVSLANAPEELLSNTEGQQSLALYELSIFPVVQDSISFHSFYSGTFVLATETGDVDIKSTGDYCDPANSQSFAGDFIYCAVNKFNFAAQASGQ